MNSKYLNSCMTKKPSDAEHSYLFLVDNEQLALCILSKGYNAVALMEKESCYYSVDEFITYMSDIAFTGTNQSDYTYVPACSTLKKNEKLEEYFKSSSLKYRQGWKLFKDKEYLAEMENANELSESLEHYISHFERPSKYAPELRRFHHMDQNGRPTSVIDMEIVDYLIETVPFVVVGITPYVYESGKYYQDKEAFL